MLKRQKQSLSQFLGLAVGLFVIWILLSGRFELKFLLIGLVSSIIISYISLPFLMIKNPETDREFFVFGLNYFKLFFYILWLIGEIFKSGIDVAREILKIKMSYTPKVIYFSMPFENPMASVFLANSIILTPGTITIDVMPGGIFEVHALNKTAEKDMLSGRMPRKVAWLFNETCEFTELPELTDDNVNGEGI